jgi:hypothetical protein
VDTTQIITLMTITLPLIGAGLGYLIKSQFEKKKELNNELNKQRREIYQSFVNLIIDIFANTKLKKNTSDQNLKQLFEFYKKYVLFASPNVIKAFSDYFQYLYNPEKEEELSLHLSLITRIMFEMRKDIGLENRGLGENGEMLMRALITDFDKIYTK